MPLGMEVGLSPGDFVFDGDLAPPQKGGGAPPQFSAHVYCGKKTAWVNMPLGTEVGLGPGDIVLNGDPAPPSPERGQSPRGRALSPIFGPCLLWPNCWMDQSGTLHEGGPWSWPHCARWVPSYRRKRHCSSPLFGPYLLWPRSPISATADLLLYVILYYDSI